MSKLFDGVDDVVLSTITAIDTGDWSFVCWCYPNGAGEGNKGTLLEISNAGADRQMLQINSASRDLIASQDRASGSAFAITNQVLAISAWSCVVTTFTASTNAVRVYVGTLSAAMAEATYASSSVGSGARGTGGTAARVGNRSALATTWDGRISRPSVFTRLLTLDEMEAFRLGAQPMQDGTLRFYLPFDSPTAGQAEDLSGNGFNGSVTGALVAEDPPIGWQPWTAPVPVLAAISAVANAEGALTLPALVAEGTTTSQSAAAGAPTLPSLATAGTATSAAAGTGSVALPPLASSGTTTSAAGATGAVALPALGASGTTTSATGAAGAPSLPSVVLAGASASETAAQGAPVLPAPLASGTATGTAGAEGAMVVPSLAALGATASQASAAAAASLPASSSSGTATSAASTEAALGLPNLSAEGEVAIEASASGDVVLPGLASGGTIGSVSSAEGSATLPSVEVRGLAAVGETATAGGGFALPAAAVGGTTTSTGGTTGAVLLPAAAVAGNVVPTSVVTGTLGLPGAVVGGSASSVAAPVSVVGAFVLPALRGLVVQKGTVVLGDSAAVAVELVDTEVAAVGMADSAVAAVVLSDV